MQWKQQARFAGAFIPESRFFLAFTYAWMAAADPDQVAHRTFWAGVRQGKWPAIR